MTAELERIAWLCGEFCRNVAHYRAGYENKDLFDKSAVRYTNFWIGINGNALDMAVLHWCKLFSEKKNDQHTWDKHVRDKDAFMLGVGGTPNKSRRIQTKKRFCLALQR